jgi:hypothetical protein
MDIRVEGEVLDRSQVRIETEPLRHVAKSRLDPRGLLGNIVTKDLDRALRERDEAAGSPDHGGLS